MRDANARFLAEVDAHARFVAEVTALRAEVQELRDIMQTVTRCARENAEHDVASLRRQLETQLARLERDPKRPLH